MDLSGVQTELAKLAEHSLIIKASKQAKFFVELGEKFDLKKSADPRTWDLVKQGLDTIYEKSLNKFGKPTKTSGQILKRKNQLLDILDSEVVDPGGGYKAARLTFAEPAQIKSAMFKGYDLFRMLDETKIGFALHDVERMGSTEKDALVRGVAYSIRNLIKEGGESATTVKRLFKGDRLRTLKEAFPDDEAFDRFRREMDDEIMMFETTTNMLRNSRTAPLDQAMKSITEKLGGRTLSGQGLVNSLISRIMSEGADVTKERVTKHLGDMLLTTGNDPIAISKILTGSGIDKIYDFTRAVASAMAEKTGRRVGARVGELFAPMIEPVLPEFLGKAAQTERTGGLLNDQRNR
jgi:hypothetical protein